MSNPIDEFEATRTVVKTLENFGADDQQRILRWAAEKLGLPGMGQAHSGSGKIEAPTGGAASASHGAASSGTDIKSFVGAKKPKNDLQFAAVVAYFHRFVAIENERKDAINQNDLLEACRKVVYKRPKKPAQTLLNAVNAGLLDKAGRGFFSVNSVGENLVAVTLPSGDVASPNTSTRSKKSNAKKSKRKRPAAKKK